ncbi:phytoene/squalene synthase family protein [Maricaulaceae bacterium EIL42A08]|nr:phytoene/squalene synthase family protein [Maricaulaceae bacterium EIL42A08]
MARRFASLEDMQACRVAIRGGSKSFYAASLLMPSEYRDRAYALYGFCRFADDEVDDGDDALAACNRLSARLDQIYAGEPGDSPVDRAFADVVRECDIPQALPAALIEGFAWDAAERRYETLSDVRAYGARVASSVGAMMALVMGVRSPEALARACDLGVAMQLTNIARDVGEDARNGRLYLPRAWFAEARIDPDAWLDKPDFNVQVAEFVRRILAEADRLYDRARPGIAHLPKRCRPAIHAASRIYREIGVEAEKARFDTVNRRVVTSTSRKLRLALGALVDAALSGGNSEFDPLPETQFLVDAMPVLAEPDTPPSWWRVDEDWDRAWAIFYDVNERRRASAQTSAKRV